MNNVDAKIGLINLADDQKLGCTIAWSVPSNICIPVDAVAAALLKRGLPDYKPTGCTPLARWKELVKNHRVSRDPGLKDMRSNECKHADKDVTSYEFSVNLPSTQTEKARLVAVGTMSMRSANDAMWWRFGVGARAQGESIDDYIDRQLAHEPALSRQDCVDFAEYAHAAQSDAARFATGTQCHSGGTVKHALKLGFISVGGFSVASRGGFWFIPRLGGEKCPYAIGHLIAEAFTEVGGGNIRFTTMHVPKDAASIEGASEVARKDFLESLQELEEELRELEALRSGQNDVRRARVQEIMQRVEVYKTLWGMTSDDLTDMGNRVLTLMDAHDQKTQAKKATKTKSKTKTKTKTNSLAALNATTDAVEDSPEEVETEEDDLTPEEEAEIESEVEAEAEAQIEVEAVVEETQNALSAAVAIKRVDLVAAICNEEVEKTLKNRGKYVLDANGFSTVIRYDDAFGLTWRLLRDGSLINNGSKKVSSLSVSLHELATGLAAFADAALT
jgi:hypothetical protein